MNELPKKRPKPALPWRHITSGKHELQFIFLFQTTSESSKLPSHLVTVTPTGVTKNVVLNSGKETRRVYDILTDLKQTRPELLEHLDPQFFTTLLAAVRERRLNGILIQREISRIANAAHEEEE